VVQKEVGAPACGIGVALGVKALTPQGQDFTSVLGLGIYYDGQVRLQDPRPRVEVAGRAVVRLVPVD
jgi:hypothetical protein